MYPIGTWFCLGNMCMATLHKGDNDDDNNNKFIIYVLPQQLQGQLEAAHVHEKHNQINNDNNNK